MKAAIFNGPNQPLKIENVDIDDPQEPSTVLLVECARDAEAAAAIPAAPARQQQPRPGDVGHATLWPNSRLR